MQSLWGSQQCCLWVGVAAVPLGASAGTLGVPEQLSCRRLARQTVNSVSSFGVVPAPPSIVIVVRSRPVQPHARTLKTLSSGSIVSLLLSGPIKMFRGQCPSTRNRWSISRRSCTPILREVGGFSGFSGTANCNCGTPSLRFPRPNPPLTPTLIYCVGAQFNTKLFCSVQRKKSNSRLSLSQSGRTGHATLAAQKNRSKLAEKKPRRKQ